MSLVVSNHHWRASSKQPLFFIFPIIPSWASMFLIFVFGPWLGYFNCFLVGVCVTCVSLWLDQRNVSVVFVVRRTLFRVMTLNFRYRRLF